MNTVTAVKRIVPHLTAAIVIVLCAHLSLWQIDRAADKQQRLDAWQEASPVELSGDAPESLLHRPVAARGRFDPERHVLLDNQMRNHHSGVHVFTPFRPEGRDEIWLVNRGWQPMTRRAGGMPQFDTPPGVVAIQGRLAEPPDVGLRLGQSRELDDENWPHLVTYFDLERIRPVFEQPVRSSVILLDPDHPAHLSGDEWRPVTFGPERHRAYAFQWAAIGSAVLIVWIALTLRSLRRK